MIPAWLRLVVVMMAVLPMAAAAGDGIPAPDPADVWRLMTQDDATSTSRCIGKDSSPGCVVDTVMACLTRRNPRLCEVALADGKRLADRGPNLADATSRYRIYRIDRVDEGYFKRVVVEMEPFPIARTGDLMIFLQRNDCHPICPKIPSTFLISVRQKPGGGWRAIEWDTPRSEAEIEE